MLQEVTDKMASLLESEFDSVNSKSSTDVGRTNLFEIDVPTTGPLIAQ